MKLCMNGHVMDDEDKFCGLCGSRPQVTAPVNFAPEAPQQTTVTPPTYAAPEAPQQPTVTPPTYAAPEAPQQTTVTPPTYAAPEAPQQPTVTPPTYSAPEAPQQTTVTPPTYAAPGRGAQSQQSTVTPVYQNPPIYQAPGSGNPQQTTPTPSATVQPTPAYQNPYPQNPGQVPPNYAGNVGVTYQQAPVPKKKKGLPVGAIIAIIVGAVLLTVVLVVVIAIAASSNTSGSYDVNSEGYQYQTEADQAYEICDTVFDNYLYTSFLYPSDATLTYETDGAVTLELNTAGDYIQVQGVAEDMTGMKKYFKSFVSDLKSQGYTIEDKGDIQTTTVGDKTLYRYACTVESNGTELQANRYVELYDGYYYEYTVVSSDGSEAALKEIISSLYPNAGAWVAYTEPEEATGDGTLSSLTDVSFYSFADGSALAYPTSSESSLTSDGEYTVLFYYGNDDLVETFRADYGPASTALESLVQSANDTYDDLTIGDIYTITAENGTTWYYQQAYYEENDYYMIFAAVTGEDGYTWETWCCSDASNQDQTDSIMGYLMYYSDLK